MENESEIKYLQDKAREIRRLVLRMVTKAEASHIGSAFSIVDILVALYHRVLRINPDNYKDKQRDKFILSKGHACAALYAVLAQRNFFAGKLLDNYCLDGSCLPGHVTLNCVPGVEASTGSLGHGLPIAAGLALADIYDKNNFKTYVLLGDGECNEGAVWEAAMFAAKYKLDNLAVIVDFNGWQAFGRTAEVTGLLPLKEKWESFGFAVAEVNGHNFDELKNVFSKIPLEAGKPSVVIAHTIKGKGVSFMEDKLEWHYKSPNEEEYRQAMKELS